MSDDVTSTAAERFVIGSILQTQGAVLRAVQEEVIPRDFEDVGLGEIYRGILRMAVAREHIDYLSVADNLPAWGVRGWSVTDLAKWATNAPAGSAGAYYARMVRKAALVRALAGVGQGLLVPDVDPGLTLQRALESLRELRDRDVTSGVTAATLREVLDVPPEEDVYDWIIPDLMERRDRLVLTGVEGGGKSTLLRQIALLSSAGLHPFTFQPIKPLRVLVVDAENSAKQWRRAVSWMVQRAALLGTANPMDQVTIEFATKQVDITRPGDQADVHRLMDAVEPDVLMIGPLYRLVPRAIKDDDDAAPVLAALDSFRERGVAMLIEAHAGHGTGAGGERDLRPRGSSALLGWPEFGLGLRREKELQGGRVPFSLVRWRGDREQRDWPRKLMKGQNWPWEPSF